MNFLYIFSILLLIALYVNGQNATCDSCKNVVTTLKDKVQPHHLSIWDRIMKFLNGILSIFCKHGNLKDRVCNEIKKSNNSVDNEVCDKIKNDFTLVTTMIKQNLTVEEICKNETFC